LSIRNVNASGYRSKAFAWAEIDILCSQPQVGKAPALSGSGGPMQTLLNVSGLCGNPGANLEKKLVPLAILVL
jgi:hypothetical protein